MWDLHRSAVCLSSQMGIVPLPHLPKDFTEPPGNLLEQSSSLESIFLMSNPRLPIFRNHLQWACLNVITSVNTLYWKCLYVELKVSKDKCPCSPFSFCQFQFLQFLKTQSAFEVCSVNSQYVVCAWALLKVNRWHWGLCNCLQAVTVFYLPDVLACRIHF